jgi:hypothetical protein
MDPALSLVMIFLPVWCSGPSCGAGGGVAGRDTGPSGHPIRTQAELSTMKTADGRKGIANRAGRTSLLGAAGLVHAATVPGHAAHSVMDIGRWHRVRCITGAARTGRYVVTTTARRRSITCPVRPSHAPAYRSVPCGEEARHRVARQPSR